MRTRRALSRLGTPAARTGYSQTGRYEFAGAMAPLNSHHLPEERHAMRLLLMGPPGSGKGTQAVHIAHQFQVPAISTGDIFRSNVAEATPLGRVAREYMDAGEYVPDQVTNAMVRDRLAQAECESGFLLDGYPRTLQQVDELDKILAEAGNTLQAVVELAVDQDVLVRRLLLRARSKGRADDTVDVIRHRHEVYNEQTAPLTTRYSERGLLHTVDGDGPIESIARRISEALVEAVAETSGSTNSWLRVGGPVA